MQARRWGPFAATAVVSAREAWSMLVSVLTPRLTTSTPNDWPLPLPQASVASTPLASHDTLAERGPSRISPLAVTMLMPNGPAAVVGP